jgi:hypothetical protein
VDKFVYHQPLYRQHQRLAREHITLFARLVRLCLKPPRQLVFERIEFADTLLCRVLWFNDVGI